MMRKFTRLCLCTVAAAVLASGCGKKDAQETTAAETTAAEAQEEVPEGKVTLGEYKGLEITEMDTTVTDEQVESQISYVLNSNPEMAQVSDRAAKEGDVVNIDYVGMKDGEAFAGGTAEGYDLELGSGSFIDGFEDGLIGAETGAELSLNLTFPENYGNAELAGQDVVFDVTVNAIKEKKDAVLDDAFVQRISQKSKTVEEYRAEIRTMLEENAKENAEYQKQNDAMDQVIASSTFEGLDAQVDAEMEQQLAQMQLALDQNGMSLGDYASMFGMDEDGFKDYMRSDVENSIKIRLVTKEIAAKENLEVDDEARLGVAAIYGLDSPDELIEAYGQEVLDEAARNMKVMNFLVENAKIVAE